MRSISLSVALAALLLSGCDAKISANDRDDGNSSVSINTMGGQFSLDTKDIKADIKLPGMAEMAIWRSPLPHAKIGAIDLSEVRDAPDRFAYTDLAIAPMREDEFETMELYHGTSGGEAALARKRRDDAIRSRSPVPIAVV